MNSPSFLLYLGIQEERFKKADVLEAEYRVSVEELLHEDKVLSAQLRHSVTELRTMLNHQIEARALFEASLEKKQQARFSWALDFHPWLRLVNSMLPRIEPLRLPTGSGFVC